MIDCYRCNGTGEIVTCIDDLCANSDFCMHGNGYDTCPACKGAGYVPGEDDDDDYPSLDQDLNNSIAAAWKAGRWDLVRLFFLAWQRLAG